MVFQKWLLELQEDNNLTQAQLGEKIGVSQSTISYVMRGNHAPSYKFCYRLASAFKLDFNDVLTKAGLESELEPA